MAFLAELIIATVVALLALIGIGMSYWNARKQGKKAITWASGWFSDFSTELAGAALITFLVLIVIVPAQKEDRKQEYIRMMASADNIAARQASEALFFFDNGTTRSNGSLRNRDFEYANWTDMHLTWADLEGANLANAALVRTFIREANLRNTNLSRANLTGADLIYSDLTNALISSETIFDETTRLPDGNYWNDGIDLSRFTNANHPQYWNACIQSLTPPNC